MRRGRHGAQSAYDTPASIRAHLALVCPTPLAVTLRDRSHTCRARLHLGLGRTLHEDRHQLELLGTGPLPDRSVLVQVSYHHAGIEYRFVSQLGTFDAQRRTTIPTPRRVLRVDRRLAHRAQCSHRADYRATVFWEGRQSEGQVADLGTGGMGVAGLDRAPAVGAMVEVEAQLGQAGSRRLAAQVRHRRETDRGVQLGLLVLHDGMRRDPVLQTTLRRMLGVPLGPVRPKH